MKKKQTKLIIFTSSLLSVFLVFLYFSFKAYDYEKKYNINGYQILERYNKEDGYYIFEIKNKDKNYTYQIKNKYIRKRELITSIKNYNNEDEICILPKSEQLNFYPLCNQNNLIYTYNLSNNKEIEYDYEILKNLNKEYQQININNLNDNSFLLYNYKGFYLINNHNLKEIKLFDKDVYSINLIYQKDNYLLAPNYNQNYYFNKIYLINISNGKLKEINFEYDISFESVFLGDYKNNVYLLDKKEEKEYKINIKKEKLEEVEYQKIKDGKLVKTDYKELINNNLIFPNKNHFKYELKDQSLYQIINDTEIKLSNNKVNQIIKNDDETVYYLCGESLYMYNNKYGEVLLMSNFEWNFNNTNMIYLYK